MDVYGVFESFDSAFDQFKKLVVKARDEFCEIVPISMDDEILEKVKEADVFEDYNSNEDEDLFGGYDESGNRVEWSYFINEGFNAGWEMFSKSDDPTDIPLLPKIYLEKVEVKA